MTCRETFRDISPRTGRGFSPMQSSGGEFADYAFPFSSCPLGKVNPYENRIIVLFSPLKEVFIPHSSHGRSSLRYVVSRYHVIPLLYVFPYASCNCASCHTLKYWSKFAISFRSFWFFYYTYARVCRIRVSVKLQGETMKRMIFFSSRVVFFSLIKLRTWMIEIRRKMLM